MNLSRPLSSLIPSLDAAILEVLDHTKDGLGTGKIHKRARRGSRQGTAVFGYDVDEFLDP